MGIYRLASKEAIKERLKYLVIGVIVLALYLIYKFWILSDNFAKRAISLAILVGAGVPLFIGYWYFTKNSH